MKKIVLILILLTGVVNAQLLTSFKDDEQSLRETTDFLDEGLTSTQIDSALISLADGGTITDEVIDLRGNDARTSASDDAFATLISFNNIIKEDYL